MRCLNHPPSLALAAAAAVLCALLPGTAQAHFTLQYPTSWVQNNFLGDPQKASPCGVVSGVTYTPTNVLTAFAPGQKITLQWTEVVPHDGWYRIAISYNNRTDLKDPPYVIDSAGNSTDAGIESPPVAPVLVDGLFPHAASIATPKAYTYDLTLPTNPCTKCTLQIIQIMLNHPNNAPYGYTYHHCADISIMAGADGGTIVLDAGSSGPVGPSDAGGSSGPDGGDDASGSLGAPEGSSAGCHCTVAPGRESTAGGFARLAGLVVLGGLLSRRRRR